MQIIKQEAVDPVVAGLTQLYRIEVMNNGPDEAVGVVVNDPLPPEVTLMSTTGCAEDPVGIPICTLGTVPVGVTAPVSIEVMVSSDAAGTISNTATVSATTVDPDLANNQATEPTAVIAQADIDLMVEAVPDPAPLGGSFEFRATVGNQGPSAASGVSITAVLPAEVQPLSTSGCLEDPAGFPRCTLGDQGVGMDRQATFTVAVDRDAGPLLNSVWVADSADDDPQPNNNVVSLNTGVFLAAEEIPSLSAVGLLLLTLFLAVVGGWRLYRFREAMGAESQDRS